MMQNGSVSTASVLSEGITLIRCSTDWSPQDLERAVHGTDHTPTEYNGTSPRIQKSARVFTASEINAQFPVPVHCEMSFLPDYPKKIYFYCKTQATEGGATSLVDFRKVTAELPETFRERLAAKGVTYYRHYISSASVSRINITRLKTWEELFGTSDKAVVEERCRQYGQQFKWHPDNSITITETRPAFLFLEDLNEITWFNHIQSFHPLSVVREARNLFVRLGTFSALKIYLAGIFFISWKYYFLPRRLSTFCTFGDGTKFTRREIHRIVAAQWKHAQYHTLQPGELLELDNRFIAHGRMPFIGKREIWVTWK